MKALTAATLVAIIGILAGCSVSRGDCAFMLPVERDRCLSANQSSAEAVNSRAEAQRGDEKPMSPPDAKIEERDSPDDKWIP
jgi:hypothetical protein